MGKYNIVINSMSTEQFPFEAEGEIDGVPFITKTIVYNGGPIWKVEENGMLPAPTSLSQFTRGQRAAIAGWAKKVEGNQELIGKPSQLAGNQPSGPSKTKILEEQNLALQERLAQMEAMILALSNKDQDEG